MKTLIAVPCADFLDVRFVDSLTSLDTVENTTLRFAPGSLVYDARNQLAAYAINNEYDYVLWLDSDMSFEADLMKRLFEDIEGKDFVSGLYFSRRPPFKPTIFEKCTIEQDGRTINAEAIQTKFIPDEIFEIDACGFGCVLMKVEVLKAVWEKHGLPFSPLVGFGEDISFCWRAKQLGYKLWCDPKLIIGHTTHMVIGDSTYVESWNQQSHD